MHPIVSAIIPVYNVEKYLDDCVRSVVAQTLREIEVILVDDGSPDRCGEICDEWAKKDSRIRVIHQKNAGAYAARNAGLAIAQGEFIGFADPDDELSPNMFETLLHAIQAMNADVSFCDYILCSQNSSSMEIEQLLSNQPQGVDWEIWDAEDEFLRPMFEKYVETASGLCQQLFRKRIIDTYQLSLHAEMHTSGDTLFCWEYALCCKRIVHYPVGLYAYRQIEHSANNGYNPDRTIQRIWVFENFFAATQRLHQQHVYDYYFPTSMRSCVFGMLSKNCRYSFCGTLACVKQFRSSDFFRREVHKLMDMGAFSRKNYRILFEWPQWLAAGYLTCRYKWLLRIVPQWALRWRKKFLYGIPH